MSLLTNSEAVPEYDSLVAFVSCNREAPSVVTFRTARASTLSDSNTTLFCLWLPATIFSRLALDKLEHPPAPGNQTQHPPTEDD
jgi:hypothetical protein